MIKPVSAWVIVDPTGFIYEHSCRDVESYCWRSWCEEEGDRPIGYWKAEGYTCHEVLIVDKNSPQYSRAAVELNVTTEELVRIRNRTCGKDYVEIDSRMLHILCTFAIETRRAEAVEKEQREEVMSETPQVLIDVMAVERAIELLEPAIDDADTHIEASSLQHYLRGRIKSATPAATPVAESKERELLREARQDTIQSIEFFTSYINTFGYRELLQEAKQRLARIDALLSAPAQADEPFCWVLPGTDTARDDGYIDARVDRSGEFTKPLYARPVAQADEPVAWDGNERRRSLMFSTRPTPPGGKVMSAELLPCPFCGSSAGWMPEGNHFVVGCGTCNGQVKRLDRADAISNWNRRASSPLAGRAEGLREAAEIGHSLIDGDNPRWDNAIMQYMEAIQERAAAAGNEQGARSEGGR